jgi:hypothetical protein
VIRRWLPCVALLGVALAGTASAQIIPRLPGGRPTPVQPVTRDTLHDSLKVKWPVPDSITQALLNKPGYSVTRYMGDTAYFDATNRALDIVAAKKKRVYVERDSQMVISDSGIYYREATRHVTTGGHYVLSSPGTGQADIAGFGPVDYNFPERSIRVTRARLPVNNGVMWYMDVGLAQVNMDSVSGRPPTVYVRGGSLTSCEDSIPDYHFEYHEAKRAGNTLVARPAILYIKDIPVMWLPFIFTDTRNGRHSGILPPQFGVGDIVRNSPTYRRNVEHVGYYWALNNYMDLSTWLDWRSGAGSTNNDPGWIKYNADWNYKWLDRFMGGRVGLARTQQFDGQTNTAVSWGHQQEFSHNSRFNSNLNYVTSTTLQRQNTFNPYAALATISSQATYQSKLGPASFSIGATRKQYPGREQVDQTFPTFSLTSTAIGIGKWLSWTPSFSYTRNDVLHMDQPGIGRYVFTTDAVTGRRDSVLSTSRSSSNSSITFDTPLQIFGQDLRNSFRVTQQRNNFAQQFPIYDVETGEITETRIFAATYRTDIDWTPNFSLPPLARNRFNLTPSLSLQNVDPGPFWVASERTAGQYVHQSKRFTAGLSASPTLYHLFGGFGPFQRIRHQISPTIAYSYAPEASVSDEYLRALGRTRKGYLGSLMQNAVTFGLQQNFEAKVAPPKDDTSGTDNAKTIRLLTINTTPISYDFVRASSPTVHSRLAGFTSETWGYSINSELLPGFDFSSSYSLFQGSALSDTAKFAPYLTSISASFNISRDQNPITILSRLFGRAVPQSQPATDPSADQVRGRLDDAQARMLAAQAVAGGGRSGDRFVIPPTQGWRASFTFSRSSPRPPVGGNIIQYDPRTRCEQTFGSNPLLIDTCLSQLAATPTNETPVTSLTAGGPAYNIPATTSLNSNVNFSLTPKWTASWQNTYDFERHEFASHLVSLQRDLHDWRALFGFSQSPNGNFAFNFSIALKAEPDLKFDYNRATVRSGVTPF